MICEDCMTAGGFNSATEYKKAENFHDKCKGDCACQHKTGPGWYVKAGAKPTLMQTQSP